MSRNIMKNDKTKATEINLFSFKTPQMRAFHITWLTFFVCFFGWFGIAPLMPIIREELHLTKSQVGNIMIASVSITIFARLLFGWLCDKFGPRITYTGLLLFGSIPLMLIGLSNSYESFLLFRLAIGVIGASFVITQYHTSVMFAPNVVGTANATVAGWGNLGGGVTQMIMPLIFGGFVAMGFVASTAWRYSMVIPGFALLIMAAIYYFFTQDTPAGNFKELKKQNAVDNFRKAKSNVKIGDVLRDYRVWILALAYGCCFGIEITLDNVAALYFRDEFHLGLKEAGIIAGLFGMMNLFARALGGFVSDKVSYTFNIQGRIVVLAFCLLLQGLGMLLFSQFHHLASAVTAMLVFALFLKMANGATYAIVPFVNSRAIGLIAGIVGAGGNIGAVIAGFVFKMENVTYQAGMTLIAVTVIFISFLIYLIRFPDEESTKIKIDLPGAAELKPAVI